MDEKKSELSENIDEMLLHTNRDSVRHRVMFAKNILYDLTKVLKKKEYNDDDLGKINGAMIETIILLKGVLDGRPLIRNPKNHQDKARGWRKDVQEDISYTFQAVSESAEQIAKEEEQNAEGNNEGN